jgi:hypothetical protein
VGWALTAIIDGRLWHAAAVFAACSVATLFGLIRRPWRTGSILPWSAEGSAAATLASAYGVAGGLLMLMDGLRSRP